jgi:hypothetical protein
MRTVNKKQLWTLFLLLVIFLLVGWFLFPNQEAYQPFMSDSPAPDGLLGLQLLLEEKGLQTGMWQQAYPFLPPVSHHLFIVAQPYTSIPEHHLEALREWVTLGNRVLFFDTSLEEWPGLSLYHPQRDEEAFLLSLDSEEPRVINGLHAIVSASSRLLLEPDSVWQPLFEDELGVLAVKQSIGKGLYLFLTPEWLTSSRILEAQHFDLIWPYFLGDWEAVWFDEYHHGLVARPGILAIYPSWLIMLILQALLILLLWLWWKGKRFGPIITPREWVKRRGDETLLATANWYALQHLTADAINHHLHYLRLVIQRKWGISMRATLTEIFSVTASRWGSEKAAQFKRDLEKITQSSRQKGYSREQLLADTQLLSRWMNEIEKE